MEISLGHVKFKMPVRHPSRKINRHLDLGIWNSRNSSIHLNKYLLITYAMSETVIHAVITYLKKTHSLSFRNSKRNRNTFPKMWDNGFHDASGILRGDMRCFFWCWVKN